MNLHKGIYPRSGSGSNSTSIYYHRKQTTRSRCASPMPADVCIFHTNRPLEARGDDLLSPESSICDRMNLDTANILKSYNHAGPRAFRARFDAVGISESCNADETSTRGPDTTLLPVDLQLPGVSMSAVTGELTLVNNSQQISPSGSAKSFYNLFSGLVTQVLTLELRRRGS